MTLGDSLRRGLAAGLAAGLLAGLFALLVGGIPVREAIRLEAQAAAAASAGDPTVDADGPLVDRPVQRAMLPVATAVVGSAFGGLFGLVWSGVRSRLRETSEWRASLKLGAVGWAAVALFPALVYPANPPAVGDPDSIGTRSTWFVVAVVVGLGLATATWRLAVHLRQRGMAEPTRQLLLGLVVVGAAAASFLLLPAATDTLDVPATLLWDFRLAAMATQLLLWAGIAVGFGWLAHRAQARERPARSETA